jgi:pilus assembly protein CpaF
MIGMSGLEISPRSIRQQIASAVHVIVQAARLEDGRRRVVSITEVVGMEEDVITVQEIFRFRRTARTKDGSVQGEFETTGVRPRFMDQLAGRGIELPPLIFAPGRRSV